MRRREFIAALCGTVAMPIAGRAQQRDRLRRVAFMGLGRGDQSSSHLDGLRAGLREHGWIEGSNLTLSAYWASGRADMDAVARQLVASNPDVIVTQELMTYAVKPLNPSSPIIFGFSGDPVDAKLVDGFARPGGNLTGMSYLALALVEKRIELLKEWMPQLSRLAILARPQHPGEHRERMASEKAATKLAMAVSYFPLREPSELQGIFHAILQDRCDCVVVFPDASMFGMAEQVARLALEAKLPTVSGWAPFAQRGLLVTYGPDLRDLYRSLGRYVDRLLRGATPADLPVELPTKFELVLNAKTAKSLGLIVPPSLLARADEVIE